MNAESRNPTRTLVLVLAACLAGWSGAAQVPGILSHQGKLMVNGTNFSGSLGGDVTGPRDATVVSRVGGVTAATWPPARPTIR